jgi:excisionase family DNA binding protein
MDLNAGHVDYSRRGTRPRAPVSGTSEVSSIGRTRAVRRRSSSTNVLLTISEVADLLGVHRSTLYRTIGRAGLPLPIIRVGATMRVPRVAVERMLGGELPTAPVPLVALPTLNDLVEPASYCSGCGSPLPVSKRPMCSAARRSSSPTAAV